MRDPCDARSREQPRAGKGCLAEELRPDCVERPNDCPGMKAQGHFTPGATESGSGGNQPGTVLVRTSGYFGRRPCCFEKSR